MRPWRKSRSRPAESSILSGTPFPRGRGKLVQYLFLLVEIEISCIYIHKKILQLRLEILKKWECNTELFFAFFFFFLPPVKSITYVHGNSSQAALGNPLPSAADLGWSVGGLKSSGSIPETVSQTVLWSFLELSHTVLDL